MNVFCPACCHSAVLCRRTTLVICNWGGCSPNLRDHIVYALELETGRWPLREEFDKALDKILMRHLCN